MNYLAHTLLAGGDEALQLGGLLGDFVHGRPDPRQWSLRVIDGIRLHRAIDVYTDAHPEVLAAKALLPAPYRRYAGILLDMWFDHCLARDFSTWGPQPLAAYSTDLRAMLHRQPSLPPALQRFLVYMDVHDLPAGYARTDRLEGALVGIGQRLSRANPLASAMPVLQQRDTALQQHFEAFFPHLRNFVQGWIEVHVD